MQCLFVYLFVCLFVVNGELAKDALYVVQNVSIPWLPVVRVPGRAGAVSGVLVDEWKDTGKASVTDGLARHWKDM